MNSRAGRFAWILLGVALLAFLIYQSGPSRIASDLALIGTGLALVVVLEFTVDGFNTLGWWFTFPPELRGGRFGKLFFVRLAGTALNATLPAASIGGEPAKVYLLHGDFPVATLVATVMTSSLVFSLYKAIFIAWGMFLTWRHIELSHEFSLAVLVGFITTLACVLAFLLLQLRGFTDAATQILRRLPIRKRWIVRLKRLGPAVDAEMIGENALTDQLLGQRAERGTDLFLAALIGVGEPLEDLRLELVGALVAFGLAADGQRRGQLLGGHRGH